jgi:tetratricopeptide (TPR) repeat protein
MRVPKQKTLFHDRGAHSNPIRMLFWGLLIVGGLSIVRSIDAGQIQPLFVPTPTATRSATSYREEGTAFFAAGNLEEAIGAYEDALAGSPDDYVGWTELARIQTYSSSLLTQERKRERLAEALASIERALALAPEDSMVHAVRAFVLDWSAGAAGSAAERQALLAEASTEAILAVTLDGQNVLALAYQAEVFVDQQQYTQATQYAERALLLDPNSFDVRRVNAYVLEAGGYYGPAIEEYKLAAEIAPNMTFIYISIGQNYRQLNLHDQALEYFDRAASINEVLGLRDPLPYVAIAKTYSRMGEFFAAALNAEKAIDIDPGDPDLYGQLGTIYFRSRNYEGSIPVLRCAIEGCTAAENEEASGGRWTVDVFGMELNDTTLVYYYTYGSVLSALNHCTDAFPILDQLSSSYSEDAVVMAIVSESLQVCENLAAGNVGN